MSWEPSKPIGFSPCGTVFGAGRKAYSARANFFADDSGFPHRINWYIVPDNTPVYPHPHVFFPRVDDERGMGASPFEKTGLGSLTRKKGPGTNYWGLTGVHWHGDQADFLGQSLRSKYLWINAWGEYFSNPCVDATQPFFPGLELAGVLIGEAIPSQTMPAGLELAGLLSDISSAPFAAGLELAGLVADPSHQQFTGGLELAGLVLNPPPPHQQITGGLELAGLLLNPPPLHQQFTGGLELAGLLLNPPPPHQEFTGGLELAGLLLNPVPPHQEFTGGLELAGLLLNPPPPHQKFIAGLELKGVLLNPPPPGPGGTCADALALTLGVAQQFTISPGQVHWFFFPITGMTNYKITMTVQAGSYPFNEAFTGSSCASKIFRFTLTTFMQCAAVMEFMNSNMYFQVVGNAGGDCTYTVTGAAGMCP